MHAREEYFARVAPVIGEGLRHKTVQADSPNLTGRVIELLAGCRLGRLLLPYEQRPTAWPLPLLGQGLEIEPHSAQELLSVLLRWTNPYDAPVVGSSGRPNATLKGRLVAAGSPPALDWSAGEHRVTLEVPEGDLFAWLNLSHTAARTLRDCLLENTPWPDGRAQLGDGHWPFSVHTRSVLPPPPSKLSLQGKHLMVIGCGSVGSELVRFLAGQGARFTLVDPGRVSPFNPIRQWFGGLEVGKPKVECLAARLRPEPTRAVNESFGPDNLTAFEALLDRDPPDLVALTTGTADHDALAKVLWQRGIAHLAACAYPRARYFEVSPILPGESTPCLACFRGHLYRGTEAPPPVSDELARFLYEEVDPADRDQAWTDLVAEPATRIETARIAEVAAQCACECLTPPSSRGAWFQRLLAQGTTCLLGANTVVRVGDDQDPAYGLTYPGQVIRLGLGDLAGPEQRLTCRVCGRDLEVRHRLELPAADAAAIDEALLG